MDPRRDRVFISYRRDDAAGYAGRLEDALERRLGRGSVFRDVQDIPPGADFVAAIRARLSAAQTVLVLIGPRWAGGEAVGARRIDDAGDFVRLEVALALEGAGDGAAGRDEMGAEVGSLRVLPLLLPGATMPAESTLPAPLQPLARLNALPLSDTHWDADVDRLVQLLGGTRVPPARRRLLGVAGVAGVVAIAAAAGAALWPRTPAPPPAPPDHSAALLGTWQADVKYAWGDRHTERFEFKRHAGQVTGTASFLAYPRVIENLVLDGPNLRFETRTQQSMGDQTREVLHRYAAELRGTDAEPRLALRMHSTGGFEANPPLEFEARPLR